MIIKLYVSIVLAFLLSAAIHPRCLASCITTPTHRAQQGADISPVITYPFQRHVKPQSGVLAYLSAGSALLGLAIASPQTAVLLILLGTFAGIAGKIGLKAYKGRPFLRTLCIIGIILGFVVLALGTVPLIFLAT